MTDHTTAGTDADRGVRADVNTQLGDSRSGLSDDDLRASLGAARRAPLQHLLAEANSFQCDGHRRKEGKKTKRPPVWLVKVCVMAAVAVTLFAPLMSAQAFASPSTPVVPTVPPHTQPPAPPPAQPVPAQRTPPPALAPAQPVPAQRTPPPAPAPAQPVPAQHTPAPAPAPAQDPPVQQTPAHSTPVPPPEPVDTPMAQAPAPAKPANQAPTAQAPATSPVTNVPTTTHAAGGTPVMTGPATPLTGAPAVASSPTPSRSTAVTPSPPPLGKAGSGGTSSPPASSPGPRTAVVTRGSSTTTIPVALAPRGIPVSNDSVHAARLAPAAEISAANPPPSRGDFTEQLQAAVKASADHVGEINQPRHWDYLDYDQYHRPSFFNPLTTDMTLRYFDNGDYRTVVVPAGGRVVLLIDTIGVFPYTAVAGDYVSVGSFLGGAWVPPLGWVGPPPVDWQPWQPAIYTGLPVDFANVGQTVVVDRVTMVGHDDSLPAGQQDVFLLDDSTLARGEVHPAPDGAPPQVTLQQTQPMPGVGPWDFGEQYVNSAIQRPPAPTHNYVPWVVGGLAAVLALLGGVTAWVWKHPRGDHAWAMAPTDLLHPRAD
jgi:hypothetical protein